MPESARRGGDGSVCGGWQCGERQVSQEIGRDGELTDNRLSAVKTPHQKSAQERFPHTGTQSGSDKRYDYIGDDKRWNLPSSSLAFGLTPFPP